jgi:hypothetical protein
VDLQQTLEDALTKQAAGQCKDAEEALAEAAEAVTEPADCDRIVEAAEDCAGQAGMLHRRRFRKIAERARHRKEILEGVPIA